MDQLSTKLRVLATAAKTKHELEYKKEALALAKAIDDHCQKRNKNSAYHARDESHTVQGSYYTEAMGVCVIAIIASTILATTGRIMGALTRSHLITPSVDLAVLFGVVILTSPMYLYFLWRVWRIIVFYRPIRKVARDILNKHVKTK
jgi:hypothetical protein